VDVAILILNGMNAIGPQKDGPVQIDDLAQLPDQE